MSDVFSEDFFQTIVNVNWGGYGYVLLTLTITSIVEGGTGKIPCAVPTLKLGKGVTIVDVQKTCEQDFTPGHTTPASTWIVWNSIAGTPDKTNINFLLGSDAKGSYYYGDQFARSIDLGLGFTDPQNVGVPGVANGFFGSKAAADSYAASFNAALAGPPAHFFSQVYGPTGSFITAGVSAVVSTLEVVLDPIVTPSMATSVATYLIALAITKDPAATLATVTLPNSTSFSQAAVAAFRKSQTGTIQHAGDLNNFSPDTTGGDDAPGTFTYTIDTSGTPDQATVTIDGGGGGPGGG
jgi:hypothetical protein